MSNQIAQAYDPLVQLLEDSADGAATHGASIGLKQNTEADIRTDLEALVGTPAVPGLKALWNTAKSTKSDMTAAFRTAKSNGRTLAMTCIGSLKPVLGQQWGSAWNAAGFVAGSLAVPANPMTMLQQFRAYYIANPGREVANINGIDCTAAACDAAAQAISTAESASNQSNVDAGTAQANYQAGFAAARRRASGLLAELGQLLEDNDPRWLAFGFEMPGSPSSPEVPENLVAAPGAAGTHMLFCHCDDSRRADGYRFVVTNSVGGAKLAEQLTQDPEVSIGNLPPGATVNIVASARNATGESQPCAPITAVVP
jgi:hypothetical protein